MAEAGLTGVKGSTLTNMSIVMPDIITLQEGATFE